MTKQSTTYSKRPVPQGAGASEMITISVGKLAEAIRAELAEFFDGEVYEALPQFAVSHISGAIIERVIEAHVDEEDGSNCTNNP